MHPSKEMQRVVDGKRYNVATATLLASDEFWDGSNWERHGRNTFLYKTRGGAFFRVDLTQWQGERNRIEALSEAEAKELYESLQEQEVDYETAFDTVVEEAAIRRMPLYGAPVKKISISLPEEQVEWLAKDGNMSKKVHDIVEKAMKEEQN